MIPHEFFDKTWRYCEVTAKRGYASQKVAKQAFTGSGRIRVYRCSFCNMWHVTTQPHAHARRIKL
jgi:hypothetical protein